MRVTQQQVENTDTYRYTLTAVTTYILLSVWQHVGVSTCNNLEKKVQFSNKLLKRADRYHHHVFFFRLLLLYVTKAAAPHKLCTTKMIVVLIKLLTNLWWSSSSTSNNLCRRVMSLNEDRAGKCVLKKCGCVTQFRKCSRSCGTAAIFYFYCWRKLTRLHMEELCMQGFSAAEALQDVKQQDDCGLLLAPTSFGANSFSFLDY